jgi:hypothetical protein
MTQFTIQWTKSQVENLKTERYAHFFALMHQGSVIYIGQAHRKHLEELIPSLIRQFNLDHLRITLFLGRIREIGMGGVSDCQMDAIHSLLVFARKPRLNLAGKFDYQGLPELQLCNSGCEIMPAGLRAEASRVYLRIGKNGPALERNK